MIAISEASQHRPVCAYSAAAVFVHGNAPTGSGQHDCGLDELRVHRLRRLRYVGDSAHVQVA